MVENSSPLIDKSCLAGLVVLGVTWLIVLWLFGLSLLYIPAVYFCMLLKMSLGHWFFSVLCQCSCSIKSFIRIGSFHFAFIFDFAVLFIIFTFVAPSHATYTDLDVDVFIISQIISAWYRYINPYSFQGLLI